MAKVDILLKTMMDLDASDLHLTSSFKPYLRIHGLMKCQDDWAVLSSEEVMSLLTEIMPPHNQRQFEREWDTDFAYEVEGLGRFRVNVFHDRFGVGSVMRLIPSVVPTIEQLNLPRALREFCYLSKGLVLVTGPTGSGKSTTLAAMIDHINKHRTEHIITIEDPIEFVHEPVRCLINQREIHRDTTSFARALRAALREDPDIVLVGEMRDLETIEIAIETAETGHLVFGTVHTNSAAATVDRVIDKFPTQRQNQIRSLLGESLKGVVAQTLCRKIGGGRVAAFEVLVINVPVAAHIREGKTFMIPSVMQTSQGLGMQTFSDELTKLVLNGKVTPEEAYIKAVDKEEIRMIFENHGVPLDFLKGEEKVQPDRTQELQAVIGEFREALKSNSGDSGAINNLAWLLATAPVDKLRNGREAVKLAEKAVKLTGNGDAVALDTLGAAYAETGAYRRAIEAAERAFELAKANNQQEMIGPLLLRLKLYRNEHPFRDTI